MAQKADKHGICSNRTLKNDNLSVYYRCSHSTQSYISKEITSGTSVDLCQEERKALQEKFQSYFDDGGIEHTANAYNGLRYVWDRLRFWPGYKIKYSLNKQKRWELPTLLKKQLHSSDCYEDVNFKVILTEHEVAGSVAQNGGKMMNEKANCISVCDSKSDKVQKKPKKKYGHAQTLLTYLKKTPPVKTSDEGIQNDNDDSEIEVLPEIRYTVEYALPPDSYPVCKERSPVPGQRRSHIKSKSKSKSQKVSRYEYWHRYSVRDLNNFHVWREENDYYDGDYESCDDYVDYDSVYTKPTSPSIGNILQDSLNIHKAGQNKTSCLRPHHQESEKIEGIRNNTNMASSVCKMHDKGSAVFVSVSMETEDEELKKQNATSPSMPVSIPVLSVLDENIVNKPAVFVNVQSNTFNFVELWKIFGDKLTVGLSLPYRFIIDITSDVVDILYERNENRLAEYLQNNGNSIYVICESLPVEGNENLTARVTLFGCKSTHVKMVQTAIDSYLCQDNVYSMLAVVKNVISMLSVGPVESLMINTDIKHKTHRQCVKMDGLQSVCRWKYKCMTPYQAGHNITVEQDDSTFTNLPQNCDISRNVDITDVTSDYCSICYDCLNTQQDGIALLRCKHWFCKYCWTVHINTKVQQGDLAVTCPEYKCTEMVDPVTLMSVMPVNQYYNHKRQQSENKLNLQLDYKWCPTPTCGRLVQLQRSSQCMSVYCDCGHLWCSECREEAHWPATCDQATQYRKLRKDNGDDNSVTSAPIHIVNVKKCPECRYPMEKNGGCNHMTCRCGFHFCWRCLSSMDIKCYSGKCFEKQLERVALRGQQRISFDMDLYGIAATYHKARSCRSIGKFRIAAKKVANKMFTKKLTKHVHRSVWLSMKGSHSSNTEQKSLMHVTDSLAHEHGEIFSSPGEFVTGITQFYSEIVYLAEHVAVLCGKCSKRRRNRIIVQELGKLTFIISRLQQLIVDGQSDYEKNITDVVNSLIRCGMDVMKTLARFVPGVHEKLTNHQY